MSGHHGVIQPLHLHQLPSTAYHLVGHIPKRITFILAIPRAASPSWALARPPSPAVVIAARLLLAGDEVENAVLVLSRPRRHLGQHAALGVPTRASAEALLLASFAIPSASTCRKDWRSSIAGSGDPTRAAPASAPCRSFVSRTSPALLPNLKLTADATRGSTATSRAGVRAAGGHGARAGDLRAPFPSFVPRSDVKLPTPFAVALPVLPFDMDLRVTALPPSEGDPPRRPDPTRLSYLHDHFLLPNTGVGSQSSSRTATSSPPYAPSPTPLTPNNELRVVLVEISIRVASFVVYTRGFIALASHTPSSRHLLCRAHHDRSSPPVSAARRPKRRAQRGTALSAYS
ncbi:hypothetical protein C8R45DRAFT_1217842 [Mycena sanguinolenta]|nr:hypothetical protein C8R45DRAFT_1217842 [Mycena sanguinolenta]